MEGKALPGTVEVRVLADAGQTEDLARKLTGFFKSNDFNVISCSPDYDDRFNGGRKKFHLVAVPKRSRRPEMMVEGSTSAIIQDGG